MKPPPSALRLVRAPSARTPPKPPFGLASFDESAAAIAIETDGDDTVASVAARIPTASELAEGTPIVMLGGGGRGLVATLIGKSEPVSRAVRSSALLVRGYRDIEASVDETSGHDIVTARA
jgi:hypothetical protein